MNRTWWPNNNNIYTYKIFANYCNQDIENSNQSKIFFALLFNITSRQSIFSHHRLVLPVLKFHINWLTINKPLHLALLFNMLFLKFITVLIHVNMFILMDEYYPIISIHHSLFSHSHVDEKLFVVVCSVMFNSLWPHGLQHAKHSCPWDIINEATMNISVHFGICVCMWCMFLFSQLNIKE